MIHANGGMDGPFSRLFGIEALPRTLFFDEDPENLINVK